MRYLETLRHTDTFDIVGPQAREAAVRLVLMLYRSGDLAMSPERAREYPVEEGGQEAGRSA